MGMVIHDDFWEACKAMPQKQRAPFLYALVAYRFDQEEPKGNPPWLPTFIAIKQRIDMGDAASKRGRKMAQARWGKREAKNKTDAQASSQQDAQAYAQAHAQAHTDAYAQASNNLDAEDEVEIEVEIPPYSPPTQSNAQDAPFWVRCLGALNDFLGTTYTTMPEKCRHMLERSASAYTVEQVREMIAYKRDTWRGTKYSKCLTPNTLFSPDHFEQYMHEAKGEAEEAEAYAKYDR